MTPDICELIAAAVITADKAVNDVEARITAHDAAIVSSDAAYAAADNMTDDNAEAAYAAAKVAYAAYLATKGHPDMTPDLDRDYYRACPDSALVEMARDSADELALVLGEALAEALSVRKNDSNYIDALEANVARLERDIDDLRNASSD